MTKIDEWTNLNIDEINQKIANIRKDIILMQINKKTKQTVKQHEIKQNKHILAQLLTLKTFKLKS
uniref:Ribosomal protein L29 n=1 Tax=Ceramothamnion japonicum TaxID=218448 RepID=A0A1C9CDN2_CERJP|nr:ribosomal protein L29 [Ceramium japonicum]AOM66467.1 ribosomal protein L29 [Ceramium japonicum]